MRKRFKDAHTAQAGACNPRPIANALVNAIDECRAEGVDPTEDLAVFLILHQLVYVLAWTDIAVGAGMRYIEAMNAVTNELKDD